MRRRGGPSTAVIKEDSQTMSFDIGSVTGTNARMAPVQSSNKSSRAGSARGGRSTEAVTVDITHADAIPDSPPDEVLHAMGVAAQAHDQLAASGRGLSFKIDDATGKVVVTVHDTDGRVMFTIPAAKALDVAAGGSLDQ